MIDDYAEKVGIALKPKYDAENLSAAIARGVYRRRNTVSTLCAKYATSSVVARPLQGEPPSIDLVMDHNKSNTSPLLKRFLSRTDELVDCVFSKTRLPSGRLKLDNRRLSALGPCSRKRN